MMLCSPPLLPLADGGEPHVVEDLHAGLAFKNPPKKTQKTQKTHLKKPNKNVFFFGFFKFLIFYENK
jgi:hypothetical protein